MAEPDGGAAGLGPAEGLTAGQTEQVQARVRLLIQITTRAGKYRKGLLAAAARLSPEEAAIISGLERHGLQVSQLRDVLCGGHVLIDDPQLYDDWRFAAVSHPRISSHHRDIDKAKYPDIGMRGAVVREKDRTATPASRTRQKRLLGSPIDGLQPAQSRRSTLYAGDGEGREGRT